MSINGPFFAILRTPLVLSFDCKSFFIATRKYTTTSDLLPKVDYKLNLILVADKNVYIKVWILSFESCLKLTKHIHNLLKSLVCDIT